MRNGQLKSVHFLVIGFGSHKRIFDVEPTCFQYQGKNELRNTFDTRIVTPADKRGRKVYTWCTPFMGVLYCIHL
jgi:hypothetical protein